MKHQALARVFAVVLAIMSLVMLVAGTGMIGDAEKDAAAAQRHIKNTNSNLEEYISLLAENEGKTEYSLMNEEYKSRQQAHDELSADHRTELATYTATQGGIEMAIDSMDQADAEFAAVKAEFEKGKKAVEEFDKGYAEWQAGLAAVQAGYEGYALMESGILAVKPMLSYTSVTGGEVTKDALSGAYSSIIAQLSVAKACMDNLSSAGVPGVSSLSGGLDGLIAEIGGVAAALPEEVTQEHADTLAAYNGSAAAAVAALGPGLDAILSEVKKPLDEGSQQLEALRETMEAGKQQIDAQRPALEAAGEQIAQGEKALYDARAQIWYEMGKLEDQAVELQQEKEQLQQEAEELIVMEQETKEQKEREKRMLSLRLGFKELEGVEDSTDAGESYENSVKAYLAGYEEDSDIEYKGRLLTAALMIAGAVMGLAAIPASFELVHKRWMLILPPLLCLLFAAASEGISMALERGVLYSSLGVVIFSIIQLLVVIPKKAQ